jgi:hypothetical protein
VFQKGQPRLIHNHARFFASAILAREQRFGQGQGFFFCFHLAGGLGFSDGGEKFPDLRARFKFKRFHQEIAVNDFGGFHHFGFQKKMSQEVFEWLRKRGPCAIDGLWGQIRKMVPQCDDQEPHRIALQIPIRIDRWLGRLTGVMAQISGAHVGPHLAGERTGFVRRKPQTRGNFGHHPSAHGVVPVKMQFSPLPFGGGGFPNIVKEFHQFQMGVSGMAAHVFMEMFRTNGR